LVRPPSTAYWLAVTYAASSESRNSATAAASSEVPTRPRDAADDVGFEVLADIDGHEVAEVGADGAGDEGVDAVGERGGPAARDRDESALVGT
jgi:hypothetical protein